MAEIIGMPKMNLTMEEGFLAKWYKAVGETVEIDEPLCSVEDAKETADMLSMVAGTLLKLIGNEGVEYPVAAPIAIIGYPGEDITVLLARIGNKLGKPGVMDKPGVTDLPEQIGNRGDSPESGNSGADEPVSVMPVKMMPRVRNLVKNLNIDIIGLIAFCGDRRITEDEVLAFQNVANGDRRAKMSAMRKSIAKNMAESCEKTARLTNFMEVDMTDTMGILKAMKDEGKRLSITAVIVKACALALREHEIVNSVLSEVTDEIIFKGEVNISCAVDIPGGLAVPVIKNADTKSLATISQEIADFAVRARIGRITNEEMKNGTFTVSNVGMLDVDFFTPIINYPQTAILGAGTIRTLPRYVDEAFEKLTPRKIMVIGLTYDHRVIDGAPASRFLRSVKTLLQNFPFQ